MKYVVVKGEYNTERIILFPSMIAHSELTKMGHVVSAGFCSIRHGKGKIDFCCYGKSESLGMGARDKRDTLLLALLLGEQN